MHYGSDMSGTTPFCVAPQTWQGGLAHYPVSQSHVWNNNIILQPEDIDEEVFTAVCAVEKQHNRNEISNEDFEALQLTFCLLTVNNSVYDLIPNGREIRVTQSNAFEFFQRVHAAYDHLKKADTEHRSTEMTLPPRLRASAARLRLTDQDTDELEWLRWNAQNDPAALAFHPGEQLRWAVVPRSHSFMIRLHPGGENTFVQPNHLALFLDTLVTTLNEIERAITAFGYYPPNCIAVAPLVALEGLSIRTPPQQPCRTSVPYSPQRTNWGGRPNPYKSSIAVVAAAATAASEPLKRTQQRASSAELEQQRALFSPTHDTGGLLAPFQELNV